MQLKYVLDFSARPFALCDDKAVLDFEPETEDAIELIIPKYITSLIYGAMIEANT